MKTLAKLLSVLLHPFFATLYAYLVVFFVSPYHSHLPLSIKHFVLALVLVNTIVIPFILLILMRLFGIIKKIDLKQRNDRLLGIAPMILVYGFTLLMFRRLGLPYALLKIMMGALVALLLTMIVTYWWRISCHSVAIGALTGFFLASTLIGNLQLGGMLLITIMLSGLLLSARLLLGHHSPWQVYLGYLVGFAIMLILN